MTFEFFIEGLGPLLFKKGGAFLLPHQFSQVIQPTVQISKRYHRRYTFMCITVHEHKSQQPRTMPVDFPVPNPIYADQQYNIINHNTSASM